VRVVHINEGERKARQRRGVCTRAIMHASMYSDEGARRARQCRGVERERILL
jgi:hypothetical protein